MASSSAVGRIAVIVALGGAVLIAALLLFGGGSSYTVTAQFQNAAQLVPGNQVEVAGLPAGSISSIDLGPNGSALVKFTVDAPYSPLKSGTIATIRSQSLSGVANRFIQLELPSAKDAGPTIPSGGTLPLSQTVSEVDLDQLFNTLDTRTIGHFKDVIKGFARAYEGIGPQTNAGFHYFNPFLSTSRQVFGELTRDQGAFQRLIVDTSSLSGALAERAPDLTALIANVNRMMGAIGSENQNLASALGQLPTFMRTFNTTAVNLRATLNDLTPLVDASKPVALKLQPFARQLRGFAQNAVPTVAALDQIIKAPGPNNDLTDLTRLQVPLGKIANGPVFANGQNRLGALPESTKSLIGGLPSLAFLRPYLTIEGVTGWFNGFTHPNAIDANGGLARIMTTLNTFSLSGPGGTPNLASPPVLPNALPGFSASNLQRCPGTNERNPGDNSTPFTDNGRLACNPSQVPVGP